jgi:orotate phosphoribosyltransferase
MAGNTARMAALSEVLLDAEVLTFGDFVTKSGRATPYFLNFGKVRTGRQISVLAGLYAARIDEEFGTDVDVLFGPAYKGIPLAVAVAQALAELQDRDIGFCFDRKEAKDHGEGGVLVGALPRDGDRVVIVEDVTTAGTSIRETVPKLRAVAPEVTIAGLVIAVDRAEKAPGSDHSALHVLADEFGLKAVAIAHVDELIAFLRDRGDVLTDEDVARIAAYRAEWGA